MGRLRVRIEVRLRVVENVLACGRVRSDKAVDVRNGAVINDQVANGVQELAKQHIRFGEVVVVRLELHVHLRFRESCGSHVRDRDALWGV